MPDDQGPRPAGPSHRDESWQQFVSEIRADAQRPFAEHWARFLELYNDRRPLDAPPAAWLPTEEQVASSNLGRFMTAMGFASYRDLHRWSANERRAFWEKAIERLGVVFSTPPIMTMGSPGDPKHPDWLRGAELNSVDSCFAADPERLAVVSGREGSERLTETSYGELERLVNRVANGVVERGFKENDGIALYMPMTLECVAAYLGIIRAGCKVISIADSFSPVEVERRMRIGGARAVITVASFVRGGKTIDLYEKARRAGAQQAVVIPSEPFVGVDLREGDCLWEDLLGGDALFGSRVADPYRVTNVLFSSGTTADPKAIPWNHLTPIKCAMDGHFHQDIRPEDVVAWPTNIGWMMGPWLIYASLINGAAMALYEGIPTGDSFARFVRDAGVTVLGTVPSLVRAWRSSDSIAFGDWDGVRVFSSTGEPSNREDYLWLMSRARYRAPVIEYCGGTEIGGGYITGTVVQPASPATFTTPALGLDFFILDDRGDPVAVGGEGELFLAPPSIGLSETLLNRDHDEVYYADCPAGPKGEVLRRHGDQMVHLPEGYFSAHGRADDTMNLGGIKISSRQLETAIDEHDAVYESAAIAVQIGDEGPERLVVYAVTHADVDAERLEKELGALIAERINPLFRIHDLVITDSLPRTASNKLMRRNLRSEYLERP